MTRFIHRPIWVAMAVAVIVVVAAAFKVSLAGATHVAPFVGAWQNDDAATREQTRAVIAVNGANFEVWGYGACVPTDCDWAASVGGPRTTPQSDAADGQLSIVWEFGFSRRTETLTLLPTAASITEASPSTSTAQEDPTDGLTGISTRRPRPRFSTRSPLESPAPAAAR